MSDWWQADPVAGGNSLPPPSGRTRVTITPNPPEAKQVLDYISRSESPSYNMMYGGGRFEELNDHPRKRVPITSGPNVGKSTSAAGRYQFLEKTWDEQAKKLGLQDFSPESQDAAAWDLASTTYRSKTGRDLAEDVRNGRTQDVGPALSPIWTSLPGGIEPNSQTRAFAGQSQPSTPQAFQEQPRAAQPPQAAPQTPQSAGDWWAADPVAQQPQQQQPTPATPAAPQMGAMEAGGRGVAQGLTFNFLDEIKGLVEASGASPEEAPSLYKLLEGAYQYAKGDPEAVRRYQTAIARERALGKQAEEQQPVANLAGNVAGAVALPITRMLQAATLPMRMVRGAAVGAGTGALYGAGSGEDAGSRLTGAASGGAVGAGLGAAAPVAIRGIEAVGQGIAAAARPITTAIRGARNPEAEAARRVMVARNRDIKAGDAGLSDAEMAASQGAGIPVANVDQGGSVTRSLARSAANTSPEARGALERVTNDRFAEQGPRAAEFLKSLVSTPANAGKTREALENVARTARKPFYDRAYRDGAGGIWDQELSELSQAPAVQEAIKAATTQAQNRASSGRAGAYLSPDGKPTLEFWDLVKRQLDQKINVARRAGAKEDVMEFNDLRSIIVNKLDAAVPSYATARGVAAELFKASNALEAGEMFVASGKIGDVRRAWSKMGPEERELFSEGFVSAFIDKINKTGDRRSILNQINQSSDARQRFDIALGPQKQKELEAFLRVENIMDRMRGALGNSSTARQLIEAGLAGGAAGGIYSGGDPSSMASGAGMLIALRQGSKLLNQRIDENVSRKVGEMLASSDPKVLQKGVALVAKSPKLMELLRASDNAAARVGGQQSTGVPALQSMGTGRAESDQPSVPGP